MDDETIFFGAKDCGTCDVAYLVCDPLTIWTCLLRPPPHSLLQIQTPHLPRGIVVWAIEPPFFLYRHALLGLCFSDNWSEMVSLLWVSSSLGLSLASAVFPEVSLFESVLWTWWMGVLNRCCHCLGKWQEGERTQCKNTKKTSYLDGKNSEWRRVLLEVLALMFAGLIFSAPRGAPNRSICAML